MYVERKEARVKSLTVLIIVTGAIFLFTSFSVLAADTDKDKWDDSKDNCVSVPNPVQRDSDADGYGNLCDNCAFIANNLQNASACNPPPSPLGAVTGNSLETSQACVLSSLVDSISTPIYMSISAVFDTGSDVILIGPTFAQKIDPTENYFELQNEQSVAKKILDNRNWGLQSYKTSANEFPLYSPESEVRNIWVRVTTDPNYSLLIGAPFANQVYAYIDHTKQITVGPQTCPAITFWPDATDTPVPLFYVDLQRFGSIQPGSSSQPTKGERYHIRRMRFINNNGANIVESPAAPAAIPTGARFLYDTGNKTTQISFSMASALGIDTTAPGDQQKEIDKILRQCYMIDRVEIDANNRSYRYVINNAVVCAVPDGSHAIKSSSDANVGNNFFEQTQVLFDGPGNHLGLFRGVKTSSEGALSAPTNLQIQ